MKSVQRRGTVPSCSDEYTITNLGFDHLILYETPVPIIVSRHAPFSNI